MEPASGRSVGTVLNSGTTTLQKCAVVPKRARIYGAKTFVSLNSRLRCNREKEDQFGRLSSGRMSPRVLLHTSEFTRGACEPPVWIVEYRGTSLTENVPALRPPQGPTHKTKKVSYTMWSLP